MSLAPSASTTSCHVDLWQVTLADWSKFGAACEALLSPNELQQADSFRFDKGRQRFVLGRGMMRAAIGKALGIAARDVPLRFSGHGKPHLPDAHVVQFNLSHSGELIVLAVTRKAQIGVDVEAFRHLPRRDQIAKEILGSDESSQYEALSDGERQTAFFTIWTRKEAIVKAVGRGLCFPLTDVEVSHSANAQVLRFGECDEAEIPWHLDSLDCPDGYVGALATSQPTSAISYHHWAP